MALLSFPDYASAVVGDDNVIFKAPLTSLPSGAVETGAGDHTYSSAGFTGVATAGINITSNTDQGDLATEGTIRVLVSPEFLDADTVPLSGASEFPFRFTGGTALTFEKTAGSSPYQFKLACSSVLDGRNYVKDYWGHCNPAGWQLINGKVEIILTWNQCGLQFWVDKFKMFDGQWVDSATRSTFANIYLNALTTLGGTYTWKDCLVIKEMMAIPGSSLATRVIQVHGNSYTSLGNYMQVDSSGRQKMPLVSPSAITNFESYTPDGLNSAGYRNGGSNHDAGMVPVCHRQLNKAGLYNEGFQFWGQSNMGFETNGTDGKDIVDRVATSISGNYGTPDVVIFTNGYNDAALNSGAGPSNLTTYEGLINTAFDDIIAVNSNVVIVICTQPYNADSGTFTPTLASVQAVNTAMKNAAAGLSQVTVVDMYEKFGGATSGSSNFSDEVHPTPANQAFYGREIAIAIINAV